MRKFITAILLSFLPFVALFAQEGHNIKVKVNGITEGPAILAFHYGNKQYIKDTAFFDSKGLATFKGKEPLPGGIYLFVLPDQNYFEFIINEQEFTLETDTTNLVEKMKVKGSVENQIFFDYLRFLGSQRKKMSSLQNEMKTASKDRKEEIMEELKDIDEQVKEYQATIINDNPETFYASVIKAMEDPQIPELSEEEKAEKDSSWTFYYFKRHFFDNLDFSDDKILRTPIFHQKMQRYIKKLTLQVPDSINKSADKIVNLSRANDEIFKYVVVWITSHYERSNIMGMDEVFHHMAMNYYLSKDAYWVDSAQRQKIYERAVKIGNNILGKVAHDMNMPDTTGKMHRLHGIDATYTIVYFWDSGCGHCKKITPQLKELYDKVKKDKIEVYAVNIEQKQKEWKKYIKKNKLNWINVQDINHQNNFRVWYDIYATPVIYLLNDKKEIVAKRLSVEQLEDYFARKLNRKDLKKIEEQASDDENDDHG